MQYKKGTFVVIPNKQYLKGKPSEMQSIYFWLCEHADDMGCSFPTKDTISSDAGCSHNTTDKYLKQLVDEGFLKITNRRKKDSQEFTSNHYQVLVLNHAPKLAKPIPNSDPTCPPNNGSETNPSINSIHLILPPKVATKTEEEKTPYSYEVALEELGNNTLVVKKIIYNFFQKKKFRYENQKQFNSAVARNLRSAKLLEGYSANQINKTMDYCEQNSNGFNWGLETVLKRIDTLINKK